MTYGLDRRLPDETAPAEDSQINARVRFAGWRRLDEQSRLRLVERQLKPANDLIDGYPLAL